MNPGKISDALVDMLLDEHGTDDSQKLTGLVARLNALAKAGDEDAIRSLILTGNNIATSLQLLCIGPWKAQCVEIVRKLAATETSFPVSYHAHKKDNDGWIKVVADLKLGSARAERIDGNTTSTVDMIDAIIGSWIHGIEYFKRDAYAASRAPIEDRELLGTDLVAENAGVLARNLVRQFEASDPGFAKLSTAGTIAFATLGRSFRNAKGRRAKTLRKDAILLWENEARAATRHDDERKTKNAKRDFFQKSEDKIRETLANMKQTPAQVRRDLTEVIESRLRTRLNVATKKPE